MERYLIAHKEYNTYNCDKKELVKVVDNKEDTIYLLSGIIADSNDELISVVHYDFVRHTSRVLKPKLNENLKLDLEEEK